MRSTTSRPSESGGGLGSATGTFSALRLRVFDVLLTMDRGIEYQQNFPAFEIAVILVSARSNRRGDMEPVMPEVNRMLQAVEPGKLYRVPT